MGIIDDMEVHHGFGLGQTSSVHGISYAPNYYNT